MVRYGKHFHNSIASLREEAWANIYTLILFLLLQWSVCTIPRDLSVIYMRVTPVQYVRISICFWNGCTVFFFVFFILFVTKYFVQNIKSNYIPFLKITLNIHCIKVFIRSHKLKKERQYIGQKKMNKRTKNGHTMIYKTLHIKQNIQ